MKKLLAALLLLSAAVYAGNIALVKDSSTNACSQTVNFTGTMQVNGVAPATGANLTALAGLTGAANSFPYFTGVGTMGVITGSANAVSLLGCADYAAMRTALSLPIGNSIGNVVIRSDTNTIATDIITEIDSGDGVTVDGVLNKDSAVTALVTVTAHTSTGNITAAECKGGVVTNTGASGAVVLSLPAAVVGYSVLVRLTVAQDVDIDPDGTDLIDYGGCSAGDKISSDAAIGSYVVLMVIEAGKWVVQGYSGTWTDAN